MIYKLNVEGYKYPIRINTDLIPIMYTPRLEKNWYKLAIIRTPHDLTRHHYFTINAIDNRKFIKMMGGEIEE